MFPARSRLVINDPIHIKNDLSLNSRVLVSNSPVYWCFSYKYPEINSVKYEVRAVCMRAFCEIRLRQSWVFPFFPLKVVWCVKKCDLSRYTWLLLDRLLRLSHFCTGNAPSLTVLDRARYCRADKCWAVKRALRSSFNVWCGVGLARALFPRFRCTWRPAKFSF